MTVRTATPPSQDRYYIRCLGVLPSAANTNVKTYEIVRRGVKPNPPEVIATALGWDRANRLLGAISASEDPAALLYPISMLTPHPDDTPRPRPRPTLPLVRPVRLDLHTARVGDKVFVQHPGQRLGRDMRISGMAETRENAVGKTTITVELEPIQKDTLSFIEYGRPGFGKTFLMTDLLTRDAFGAMSREALADYFQKENTRIYTPIDFGIRPEPDTKPTVGHLSRVSNVSRIQPASLRGSVVRVTKIEGTYAAVESAKGHAFWVAVRDLYPA